MPGATSTPCRGWATRCGAAPGPGRRPYTLPCATWRGRASTAPPVARHGRVGTRGSLVRARAYARPREPRGHNDVSPMNLTDEHGLARRASRGVFGPGPPSPAPPAWDLARGARQFAPLSRDAGCARDGWSSPPDRACRLRILSDGYGLSDQDRRGFVGLVARHTEATASGIEALAAGGSAPHERLVRRGVPTLVRDDKTWVGRNAGDRWMRRSLGRCLAADSHRRAAIMSAQSGRSAAW